MPPSEEGDKSFVDIEKQLASQFQKEMNKPNNGNFGGNNGNNGNNGNFGGYHGGGGMSTNFNGQGQGYNNFPSGPPAYYGPPPGINSNKV